MDCIKSTLKQTIASFSLLLRQLKTFFSTFPWKNVLLFSVFLLLASILWLMLFFDQEDIEDRVKIPVQIINIADDIVLNVPPPASIEVAFKDNGRAIIQMRSARRDTLRIDMATFIERDIATLQGPEMQYLIRDYFSRARPFFGLRHRFSPNPTNISPTPTFISLEITQLESKELAVVFDGEITTHRANLEVGNISIFPDTIRAYGSSQVLEELEIATTIFTSFRYLRNSERYTIQLNPVEGVRFVPEKVNIYIPVLTFTERSFDIPITATHVPEHLRVKFFPPHATVTFSATIENYRDITAEDFEVQLYYYDFFTNENGRVVPHLTQQADGIRHVRLSPASVEFLFELLPDPVH